MRLVASICNITMFFILEGIFNLNRVYLPSPPINPRAKSNFYDFSSPNPAAEKIFYLKNTIKSDVPVSRLMQKTFDISR